MKRIEIKEGTLDEALQVSKQIPEFDTGYGIAEYTQRLKDNLHLILIAWFDGNPVGFKVGYQVDSDFYSWMGGVIPEFRNRGIARHLAEHQEAWAKEKGFTKIKFKTQNKFKGMLIFALKNGFSISGTTKFAGGEGFKIVLEKKLDLTR